MRIVLTNDDGYDAPGLRALWEAVTLLPDAEVQVIAPLAEQSGRGHTFLPEIRCRRLRHGPLGEVVAIDGTPADCVRVALALPGLARPDWLLSGINRGANLGVDVYNSGTIAAAREAAIHGLAAVAVSYLVRPEIPDDWARCTRQTAALLSALLQPGTEPPTGADREVQAMARSALDRQDRSEQNPERRGFWNINLPRLKPEKATAAVELTRLSTDPTAVQHEVSQEPDGVTVLRNVGRYLERPAAPGTDVAATFSGRISLTRISL